MNENLKLGVKGGPPNPTGSPAKNFQEILKSGKCDTILKTKNGMTILHVKCSIGHPILAVSYERHIVTHNAD